MSFFARHHAPSRASLSQRQSSNNVKSISTRQQSQQQSSPWSLRTPRNSPLTAATYRTTTQEQQPAIVRHIVSSSPTQRKQMRGNLTTKRAARSVLGGDQGRPLWNAAKGTMGHPRSLPRLSSSSNVETHKVDGKDGRRLLQHGLETSNLMKTTQDYNEPDQSSTCLDSEEDRRVFEYKEQRDGVVKNIHDARRLLREQNREQYRDELARQIEARRYERDAKRRNEIEEDRRRLEKLAPSPSARSTRRYFSPPVDTFEKIVRHDDNDEDEEDDDKEDEIYRRRPRERNPMKGMEPPPSGRRRVENESVLRSSQVNPIRDGHPWEPDTLQLGGRRQYEHNSLIKKDPILEPPEERVQGLKKFDTNRGHGDVNPILSGHPWQERSRGMRKFNRGKTNIQGYGGTNDDNEEDNRSLVVGGKRRITSSAAKSTAYDVIRMRNMGSSNVMVSPTISRGIQSTYNPIHGTGVHRTLPHRQRLGERIGVSW